MRTVALYQMLFGLTTLVLGIYGIAAAGSVISLVVGIAAGLTLFGAGMAMQKGSRRGRTVALILSLALGGYFGWKIISTGWVLLPSGLLSILAALSILSIVVLLLQPKKRERIF